MSERGRSRGRLGGVAAVVLVSAAASIVPLPGTSAVAVAPATKTATSPATGTNYTMTWSCASGQVRIVGTDGPVDFEARFNREPDDLWLTRRPNPRESYFSWSTGGDARNDNETTDRVVLEDRPVGSSTWTSVMSIDVPNCPDYGAGTTSVFQSVTPERVLDTRAESAVNHSGPKPGAGSTIKVPRSAFPGLPADATAVSITLTGTQVTAPGFLQAFPTGKATAGSSSNVNFPTAGGTVANLAVVPLGTDGSISVFSSGGAHVLVDVNGYFVEASGDVSEGRLETIAQQRMLDTRPASAVNYSGAKPSRATLNIDLTANNSGLPTDANAAVVNITATETSAPGFVQSAAGDALTPGTSSVLNVVGSGQTVAGLSIVPLASDGSIDLYTSSGAHLIVDLIGWFTGPSAAASTTGQFVAVDPERIFDNRQATMVNADGFWKPSGLKGGPAAIYLAGMGEEVGAVFVNGTLTGNEGPGFAVFGQYYSSSPTSNINVVDPGSTVANAAIVATAARRITVTTPNMNTYVIIDLAGYFTT